MKHFTHPVLIVRISICLLFVQIFFSTSYAENRSVEAGKGTIKGFVQTADGKPAGFVNVSLKGLAKGSITNEKGEYLIKNVPEGAQTVIVQLLGYSPIELNVTVAPNETTTIPAISLNEDSNTLQEVWVRGNVNKFAHKESDYVARLPLKNLENPQVYTAVNKALISDQVITDFKETLRNVPGVAPLNNPAGGTGATIRGFTANTTIRNGMAVQIYQSDVINLERVEVIKGPSGTLFGSSLVGFGGLINQVTKKTVRNVQRRGCLHSRELRTEPIYGRHQYAVERRQNSFVSNQCGCSLGRVVPALWSQPSLYGYAQSVVQSG